MATWNTVNLSEIRLDRFDAEYFRKDYKKNIEYLKSTGEVTTLRRLFKTIDRGSKAEYKEFGSIPVLRSVNVRALAFNDTRQEYVSQEYYDLNPKGQVFKDDIIITSTGTGTLGRTSIWYKNSKAFNVPENSFLRYPKDVDPYLIAAYLNTDYGTKQLFQNQRGSSGQLHLYPVDIRRIIVPMCLFPHQQEIGKYLRNAFELQEHSQAIYQQATELLEKELGLDNSDLDKLSNKYVSSFNDVVIDKRFDPEFFNPKSKILVQRIKDMTHTTIAENFYIKNGFPWNSKKFIEDNSGEPVIRIRDIKPTYIDKKNLTSLEQSYANTIAFQKAKANDVVVGMDGLKYFYGSILEDDCLVNQRVCHLARKSFTSISPEYATFIINSEIGQAQLLRDMTVAATVGHITNLNIAKLVIPLVSKAFHDKITDLIRMSINAEKESKSLLELSKTRVEEIIKQAATK